jgi:hypothetical protein
MPGEIATFMDDLRLSGQTVEHSWSISRSVSSRLQRRGIQYAYRKRRPPTRSPGAWAGAVFQTTATTVTKTVAIEKWIKGKNIISEFWSQLNVYNWQTIELDYKNLERARGFLGHLSMTFEILVPYLKGFHLTLASYLPQRDKEGWKLSDKEWALYVEAQAEESEDGWMHNTKDIHSNVNLKPPQTIKPLGQLKGDVYALNEFYASEDPPIINDRNQFVNVVSYGFGDASGTGFGSLIQTASGISYRIGVWGSDDDCESSNFKEFENVVMAIEEEINAGRLSEGVLLFFTDNSTVEAALYKGNSKSRKLFKLIVKLRKLQLSSGVCIIASHVSGKRMIEQGTDGVSRGCMKEGVAASDKDMLSHIPLHLSALQRHPNLAKWLEKWIRFPFEILTPEGWYERGHGISGGYQDHLNFWHGLEKSGIFVWCPPPGAAEVAVEELRKSLIKRQVNTHIFVCPCLLSPEWRKQLNKACNLVISIDAGHDEDGWPLAMHEPLDKS